MFGGSTQGRYFNEAWRLNLKHVVTAAPKWMQFKGPGENVSFASCAAGDERIFLHAGLLEFDVPSNHLFEYDIEKRRWKNLTWFQRDAPLPISRTEAIYRARTFMTTFGRQGKSDAVVFSKELYTYNVNKLRWTTRHVENAPNARELHTFTQLDADHAILLGGAREGNLFPMDYIGLFNSKTLLWTNVCASGAIPSPMACHNAVALDSNRILVFCGARRLNDTNAFWVLRCQDLMNQPTSGIPPQRLQKAVTARLHNFVLVAFGGYTNNGTLVRSNSHHLLNTDTWKWVPSTLSKDQ
jgi:hypothetical protein